MALDSFLSLSQHLKLLMAEFASKRDGRKQESFSVQSFNHVCRIRHATVFTCSRVYHKRGSHLSRACHWCDSRASCILAHVQVAYLHRRLTMNSALKYKVILNDCRVFNNLSYTIHLRQQYVVAPMDQEIVRVFFNDVRCAVVMHFSAWSAVH